nr:LOW QUALITY PROTEIN: TNF receptor-associated factor 1 [Zootoca vivipara]
MALATTWALDRNPLTEYPSRGGGNAEDRKEHGKYAEGTHLMLLLQHVKQLKASLHPACGTLDTHLIDSNVLMGIFLSMKLQGTLVMDCSSRLPLCEEGMRARRHSWTANGLSLLEGKLQVFENIVSVLSKEMVASWQNIVAFQSQSSLDQDMIRGLELKESVQMNCNLYLIRMMETILSILSTQIFFISEADMDESVGFPRFVSLAKPHSLKHAYLRDGTLFLLQKCYRNHIMKSS